MMHFRGTDEFGHYFGDRFGNLSNFMHNGWGFLIMGVLLVVAVLIVVAIVALVRRSHRKHPVHQADDSLELLNVRFVKGEISEEDYIRIKKILRGM